MSSYKHLLFDLDHTLWDFQRNAAETLHELYQEYALFDLGHFSFQAFENAFIEVNEMLWKGYNQGIYNKEKIRNDRFKLIFSKLGVSPSLLPESLPREFLKLCPTKNNTLPHTFEVLEYLNKGYILHIISNGFEDVQFTKLKSANINHYFDKVITSDIAGARKPDKAIFEFALSNIKARPEECLMIGDNLTTDILGAKNVPLDHIFFNPEKIEHWVDVTYEIESLNQLRNIL